MQLEQNFTQLGRVGTLGRFHDPVHLPPVKEGQQSTELQRKCLCDGVESFSTGYDTGSSLGRDRHMGLKSEAMVAQSLGQRDLLEGECWVGAGRCVLGLAKVVSFTCGWGHLCISLLLFLFYQLL